MKVRINVSLPHDDVQWLNEEYPDNSVSSILTLLIHEFRSIHRDVGFTPKKAAKDSAKEIKAQIDEGLLNGVRKED